MLQADCESVNSGEQRYRASRYSKSAKINRQSASDSGGPENSGIAESSASTGDGESDGDDDSSEEVDDDNGEESEAIAPSGESGSKKKMKRSTGIQQTTTVDSASNAPGDHKTGKIHQMGLSSNGFSPQKPAARNSILQEDGGDGMESGSLEMDYPRKKSVRRLSNNNGFLAYGVAVVGSDQGGNNSARNKDDQVVGSSDDESYKGVDLISDSEEGEPDVEKAEARVIIDSEEETDCLSRTGLSINRSGTALSGRVSDWGDFDVDDGLLLDDIPLFNQQYTHLDHSLSLDAPTCNGVYSSVSVSERSSGSRHVRFEDDAPVTDSTGSNTSDEDDEAFPDLFLDQDRLDPAFLRMIENDHDGDDNFGFGGSEDGSYWDFRGSDDFGQEVDGGDESSDIDSSMGSSSGYESDEGETTDEDLPPPPTITPTRSVLRRISTSSIVGDGENTRTFFQRSLNQASRIGPSMGSWIADPSKPIAFIDSTGKRMLILPASQPATMRSHQFGPPGSSDSSIIGNSPRTAFSNFIDDSDGDGYSSQDFGATVGFSGGNLMMGGLLHGTPGNEFILGGQVLGPPEAFYPFTSIGSNGIIEDYEDDLEDEDLWSVSDFIDFGGGSSCSDNDDDQDTGVPISPTTSMVTNPPSSLHNSPSKPDNLIKGRDTTQSMISHFDKGVVGAFHRNQQRHRQFLTRHEPRAFTPSMSAVLRGIAIKGGRHAAANCPITPVRKRKAEHAFGPSPSGSSLPGTGSKRRMLNAHKRSKSIF
ncbi:hypothetical protein FGG08_002232 [Glutinoglossum americanum]|uniref:Uncharacterized protein n=1 Tax=Glutinoglossum americanum TaxID=1670608 RepID=A0A9P8IC19_9PEZI|nr:hypothetical protein FGG08_002232 [Glutinoglossum americanum]